MLKNKPFRLTGLFAIVAIIAFSASAALSLPRSSAVKSETAAAGRLSLFCDSNNSPPTTSIRLADGRSQPQPMLYWRAEDFGSAAKAQQLCNELSPKLNSYYNNHKGELYFATGLVNGKPIVCVEESQERLTPNACTSKSTMVLFTLEPKPDADSNGPMYAVNRLLNAMIDNRLQPPGAENLRGYQSSRYQMGPLRMLQLLFRG